MDRLPEIYFQSLDEVNNIWEQLIHAGGGEEETEA